MILSHRNNLGLTYGQNLMVSMLIRSGQIADGRVQAYFDKVRETLHEPKMYGDIGRDRSWGSADRFNTKRTYPDNLPAGSVRQYGFHFPKTVKGRTKRGWTAPRQIDDTLRNLVQNHFLVGLDVLTAARDFDLPVKFVRKLYGQFAVEKASVDKANKDARIEASRRYHQWLRGIGHTAEIHVEYLAMVLPAYAAWRETRSEPDNPKSWTDFLTEALADSEGSEAAT